MIDELGLPTGSQALDVGCGAGAITVDLASRGYIVNAVDHVREMIELTQRAASEAEVASNLMTSLGDIQNLAFRDSSFDLVLAIGVLPWLSACRHSLSELARVLKPGGYLITNIDNRWALHRLIEPTTNFILAPLRIAVREVLYRSHLKKREPKAFTTMVSRRGFESLLGVCGFIPLRGLMLGFGPFSVFGYCLLPGALEMKFNDQLQRLCDRGFPFISSTGAQYLLLARKN